MYLPFIAAAYNLVSIRNLIPTAAVLWLDRSTSANFESGF